MRDEELYKLADAIYEGLIEIPCRLMKHKCGAAIGKETAVTKIYLVLENNKLLTAACTRAVGHEPPCNGLPREGCPQIKVFK
jgi:hypothetical protein